MKFQLQYTGMRVEDFEFPKEIYRVFRRSRRQVASGAEGFRVCFEPP